MIELQDNSLVFSFPEVHEAAVLRIDFERTLRIPDDDDNYCLPPGLGKFPIYHVDDYAGKVPEKWIEHGGVMFPMYQAEAMWINFRVQTDANIAVKYPFAVKIATGKINAVTGDLWSEGLHDNPQDYVVVPEQPWLDGYCVEKGVIRQFVAMPLGSGYSVEEQITDEAEYGGLQLQVYPLKREAFERRYPEPPESRESMSDENIQMVRESAMSFAAGGQMKQEVYEAPYNLSDWDGDYNSRCFVHIANSMLWGEYTGENPPTTPPTAKEYTQENLPWFDWYDEKNQVLSGAENLANVKSVAQLGKEKDETPLPENKSVTPQRVIRLRKGLKPDQVREWSD